ncbi:MAG: ribosome small subunit-dependent GTPase A [Bacteroidales bacterium]|jgi:ribosome biogenesis GTPase
MEQQVFQNATVIKQTGSLYRLTFLPQWDPFTAVLSGKLRLKGDKLTNPVAVGDKVNGYRQPAGNGKENHAVISEILPRKNYLIRKSVNLSRQAHIIAANIDWAYILLSATEPETPFQFIDRFLVTCQAYRVPVTLIINKTDELQWARDYAPQAAHIRDLYQKAGYPVMEVSAKTGEGTDKLTHQLKDKISLFSGISGVGKSSLANKLDTSLHLKTAPISQAHLTGKHTTTFYEMHPLQSGGYIIDSPGIRGFGLLEITKEELSHYFPEIFAVSANCRFNGCLHAEEPDCAVRDAVKQGLIPAERYESYLKMLEDPDGGKYRT